MLALCWQRRLSTSLHLGPVSWHQHEIFWYHHSTQIYPDIQTRNEGIQTRKGGKPRLSNCSTAELFRFGMLQPDNPYYQVAVFATKMCVKNGPLEGLWITISTTNWWPRMAWKKSWPSYPKLSHHKLYLMLSQLFGLRKSKKWMTETKLWDKTHLGDISISCKFHRITFPIL